MAKNKAMAKLSQILLVNLPELWRAGQSLLADPTLVCALFARVLEADLRAGEM